VGQILDIERSLCSLLSHRLDGTSVSRSMKQDQTSFVRLCLRATLL
jgi:hypothetical protein